ncbi:(2Fe-2S)-binding protein [Natrialba sp. INN-245]|uniref:(2Fe-2S)-binding protein n=1 Tax=Natrialba sp. INN-245 TaxID=2690967 RepID=UPI0013122CB8|nr:(2Fe-2S)-binding protein [Natrialba sp. INN-245]MWV38489.1 2Fe-2S iron-sulfur cluster binding domain-containing protein [Natrialba sp. INN-245]
MTVTITFELDGESVTVETRPDQPLRELLRESLDAKQVKSGCESGRCGVCTVLLDDTVVKSCLTPAPKVDGRRVRTIADIGTDENLHPVQTAFVDNFAAQCGYCTPGFVLTTVDFLENTDEFDREDAKKAIKGNVCRCTGYEKILDAIEALDEETDAERDSPVGIE